MNILSQSSTTSNSTYYLGTKSPYLYKKGKQTPPPCGYEPFYINYLGRHGSRYLESTDKLMYLIEVLQKNKKAENLTDAGKYLLNYLQQQEILQRNKYGGLTPAGAETMKSIARRMYQEYPKVFGKKVYAESTYVQRAIDSMFVFINELFLYTPSENFIIYSNGEIDPLLRFFDLNLEYKAYKASNWWTPLIKEHFRCSDPSIQISQQFFITPVSEYTMTNFAPSLFDVLTEAYGITIPPMSSIDVLRAYYTSQELCHYWEVNNLDTFYSTGPSGKGIMLPTNISFALLRTFIETSNTAIQSTNVSANLRFAHAETIIPFASLLNLPCCSKQTNILSHVAEIWRDFEVAPMAANLAWIFYKNPECNDILVKMTYNEEEICFPFPSTYSPYATWEDVQNYYCAILDSLNIDTSLNVVDQVTYYQVDEEQEEC